MNTDREWLLIKSEQEDGCMVSVGGLTYELEENQNNNIFDRWTLGKAETLRARRAKRTDGSSTAS